MFEELGNAFVFLGIALVFLGIILMVAGKGKGKVEAGGVVFVGPFPVFLGATSKTALVITVVVALIMLISLVVFGWLKFW